MFSTSTRLKFVNFLLLFLVILSSGFGQVNQLSRLEINIDPNDENENYQTANLKEDGILVYRRIFRRTEDQLELIKIDTALNETWRGYIAVQKELRIAHVKPHLGTIYVLLKSNDYTSGDFQLLAAQIQDGTYTTFTIRNLIPFNPTDFNVTAKGAMLGGYFNYRPLVLFFSFSTLRARILPGFFNERGEINQLKTFTDGSFDVILSANNFERKKCLWIRNYDAEGDLVKTTVLEPGINKNLIFGRSVKMPNDEQVVTGVYGGKYSVEYSRGIFVAEINPIGEYTINYYNFSDLQNFFSYMKAKREKRVKERIERRKVKGKKIRFNYRFLIHEVIPYSNKYVMLGEAFYPHYTYISNRDFGIAQNPLVRGDRIFDGYQYTHAVVIGFDSKGKLIWDNSFEINDVKTMELQQFVKIAPGNDRIALLYLYDNLIRSKVIKDDKVLEGKTADPVKAKFEGDVIKEKDTEVSKLDYWYKDHFVATGIQKVRNKNNPKEEFYRKVFFINKLKYQ